MPFCTQCGAGVENTAAFCSICGARQPRAGSHSDPLDRLSDRTAIILCYIPIFGIIPAIIFLASQKYRLNVKVRFNAFQSLYLFVAWLIVSSAIPILIFSGSGWGFEHPLLGVLKILLFVCWIYLLVKAAQEQPVRLPIIGDLAARSTMEQM